jgi:hypothetical protein
MLEEENSLNILLVGEELRKEMLVNSYIKFYVELSIYTI